MRKPLGQTFHLSYLSLTHFFNFIIYSLNKESFVKFFMLINLSSLKEICEEFFKIISH